MFKATRAIIAKDFYLLICLLVVNICKDSALFSPKIQFENDVMDGLKLKDDWLERYIKPKEVSALKDRWVETPRLAPCESKIFPFFWGYL
jgi:hypothetical protein